jgi:pSer/pThr/pTyr-binding forkhead associated (FHA) protein
MPQTIFTIGRDPAANLFIQDPSISRFHAVATLHENGALLIADSQSSNGTFLIRQGQESRFEREWVVATDTVKFGGFAIRVAELLSIVGAANTAPTPAAAPASVRLIRCSCGAVKTAGVNCPACRQ